MVMALLALAGILFCSIGDATAASRDGIVCGDADGSGAVDLADVIYTINYLYSGGPAPDPLAAGDQNCDGKINIADCSYLIAYIFEEGAAAPCCPSEANYCPRDYTTSFDLETAHQMSELAHWAYFDKADFKQGNIIADCWVSEAFIESDPDADCDVVISPGQEDTQLFIARDPWTEDIVVSFRGSATLQDWISDGQFANPANWTLDDGTVVNNAVHKGFLCAYQSIEDQLRITLSDLLSEINDPSTARVYFTGHSLGAALATLAALDLATDFVNVYGYDRDNIVLYTVGSPRPFKPVLLSHFRSRVTNAYTVIEKTDPVPYLLPTYTHINSLAEINSKLDASQYPIKTRLEFINGEDLVDCGPVGDLVPWSFGQAGHDHRVYQNRLANVVEPGLPKISLSIKNGYFNYQWSGDVQGPCDRVVLCEDCPDVFTDVDLLLLNWNWVSQGSSQQTILPKREGMQLAYIDDYGRLLNATVPYVAKTPTTLTIKRQPLGVVEVNWKVSDEGLHDYVALYKTNPISAGPNAYVAGTKHTVLTDLDDKHSWVRPLGPYWVAFVTADAAIGGHRRILRVAGPID